MAINRYDTTCDDEGLAAIVARRGDSDRAMQAAQDAFGRLYRRHTRRLLVFLASNVKRSELDDIHQDIWLRVWSRLPDQYRRNNYRAWLYLIARNALIDHTRKGRHEALADEATLPDRRDRRPDEPLIEQERLDALARCLDRRDMVAATLVRARLGGEGYHEVCLRLKLTPRRAHKLFYKAKKQLQVCVERALG